MAVPNIPPIRLVIFHTLGRNWIAGRSPVEQPAVAGHLTYLGQLADSGRVLQSGPFLDGSGGMAILAPDTGEAEAAAIIANDPAVQACVITAEVRQWGTTIDFVRVRPIC